MVAGAAEIDAEPAPKSESNCKQTGIGTMKPAAQNRYSTTC
jgi:hypothetical protein